MRHLDLFSGIGGFAYAIDEVFYDQKITHTFCEIDPFCRAVLRKHWHGAEIITDVRTLADTADRRCEHESVHSRGGKEKAGTGEISTLISNSCLDILTGGFPCQPFSQAGLRKGTSDERHLWPAMLAIISKFRPRWVVAENVKGLLTISDGLVFESVCSDLEREGYEVQPFIIPACAVGAPHRRDRVWIVANRKCEGQQKLKQQNDSANRTKIEAGTDNRPERQDSPAPHTISQRGGTRWTKRTRQQRRASPIITDSQDHADDTEHERLEGRSRENQRPQGRKAKTGPTSAPDWSLDWREVATSTCSLRMDDGLPVELDGLKLSKARHRVERLKSLGNSIVPQVAMTLFSAIKAVE